MLRIITLLCYYQLLILGFFVNFQLWYKMSFKLQIKPSLLYLSKACHLSCWHKKSVRLGPKKKSSYKKQQSIALLKNVRNIQQFHQGFFINKGPSHHQQASWRLIRKQGFFEWRRNKLLQNLNEKRREISSELNKNICRQAVSEEETGFYFEHTANPSCCQQERRKKVYCFASKCKQLLAKAESWKIVLLKTDSKSLTTENQI